MTTQAGYLNHGRWVVECAYCPSAEAVAIGATTFVCRNQQCTHYLEAQSCVLPDNATDIEEVVMFRPDAKNRNWVPGETVETLLIENLTHSHGLPLKHLNFKPAPEPEPVKQEEVLVVEVAPQEVI